MEMPLKGDQRSLARRLGAFDATMIVMGGIVGSGIFMNPYVVAKLVHTPFLILFVWIAGGLVALAGSFVYSELASRRPNVGGQYAYLRDGIHPMPAFLYGWTLLLVIQSGGMAAVALTFARYFLELSHIAVADWLIATLALFALTVINCIGVRAGSTTQSILMLLKIGGILILVLCGIIFGEKAPVQVAETEPISPHLLTTIGAAMVPVLFAYGGWQTSGFVAGEMKNPRRDLPFGSACWRLRSHHIISCGERCLLVRVGSGGTCSIHHTGIGRHAIRAGRYRS